MPLTAEGEAFFPFAAERGTLAVTIVHREYVHTPATDFIPLAEEPQFFLSKSNNVLTMQGHPEIDQKLAKRIVEKDFKDVGTEELKRVLEDLKGPLDNVAVWSRILGWVRE